MRLIAGLVLALLAAVAAAAAENVDTWAKRTIDEGFALLRDDTGGTTARRARFHAFIVNHVDARKSALFALGIYRKGAEPVAIEEYAAVFADYTIEIYQSRLENYKDATLSITDSIENKPGDFTVSTLGTAPRLREPVRIGFRLRSAGETFKITDVQVEGIWLSIELRDQFNALLGANGGDIRALARTLVTRTNNLRAGNAED